MTIRPALHHPHRPGSVRHYEPENNCTVRFVVPHGPFRPGDTIRIAASSFVHGIPGRSSRRVTPYLDRALAESPLARTEQRRVPLRYGLRPNEDRYAYTLIAEY